MLSDTPPWGEGARPAAPRFDTEARFAFPDEDFAFYIDVILVHFLQCVSVSIIIWILGCGCVSFSRLCCFITGICDGVTIGEIIIMMLNNIVILIHPNGFS